ncbi:hypothetical protein NKR23_g8682 [Pleurostoma richardsiae]|uniref:Thiaminase-2/PQQC domain-containing protein n=1 Tax=Pleurostoma richardsiae TaxID=41990 RepID=A0AA38RSM1_9PEZI|nr:hypothetical protein NKR23_g8682 [Pleurostoma richardsiae]
MTTKIESAWSLTKHLLSIRESDFEAATQSPFLRAAGEGRLQKDILGKWLANDRLYIHAYIKAAARTLAVVDLPQTTQASDASETLLVDWLLESLVALRREERLFIDVAKRYGLAVDLETTAMTEGGREDPRVPGTAKLPGLVMFERLFGSLHPAGTVDRTAPLPWLEAAVVFWGTEKVYLEAWRWARSHQEAVTEGAKDVDGGALRDEFIPNWSNNDFADFVERLTGVIDRAVADTLGRMGDGAKGSFVQRTERLWIDLLAAESAFWPSLD